MFIDIQGIFFCSEEVFEYIYQFFPFLYNVHGVWESKKVLLLPKKPLGSDHGYAFYPTIKRGHVPCLILSKRRRRNNHAFGALFFMKNSSNFLEMPRARAKNSLVCKQDRWEKKLANANSLKLTSDTPTKWCIRCTECFLHGVLGDLDAILQSGIIS